MVHFNSTGIMKLLKYPEMEEDGQLCEGLTVLN